MPINRREALKTGARAAVGAAALAVLPRPLFAQLGARPEPVPPVEDPRLKALALRGVEAARAAGASYVDARLSHTFTRTINGGSFTGITDAETMVAGVRALVQGYWGFASSPVWSPDEMARLGREAVHQAKVNAQGETRPVTLAPTPVVADGHWTMPVKIDPFAISPFEIVDYLRGLTNYLLRFPDMSLKENDCRFDVEEVAFASSEGSYCTQRRYRSAGAFSAALESTHRNVHEEGRLECLTPAGLGWELYTGQPLRDEIAKLVEDLEAESKIPWKPVDVGRYTAACDAWSVAQFVDATLGHATELDRALGYEANASGTSWLNEPLTMLGTFKVGAPRLTLTANRSEPGGVATTRWDEEGVAPDEFPLVKDGVLADFQTTRESASWLGDYYAKAGRSVRSHGCAAAPSALELPLTHTPNLVLAPGHGATDFESAVKELGTGIAVRRLALDMDFQSASGLGTGTVYDVKGGKRVSRLVAAGLLFRASELWKGLAALGSAAGARRYGTAASRGEPPQVGYHSITAPPATFEQMTLVDIMRKA
jgi:TldD protein